MELAQHILVHSLALINNRANTKSVTKKFENGIEFCMQTAADILQLQVQPKSKYPTHFIEKSFAQFGIIKNKVVLIDYWNNLESEIVPINSPMDFDLFFDHNKNSNLKLLMPISEHLFYDQVADDMYFVRLSKMLPNGNIQSNKTGKIINEEEFLEIKKYLNILITRMYISKLKNYGIELNKNIVQKWCDAMKIVFNEECWVADTYLKGHMNIVFDIDNLSNEYIAEKIQKLLSVKDLEDELITQLEICSNAVKKIYESKNFNVLRNNIEKILSAESEKRRKNNLLI